MKTEKILVTGASGYQGKAIVEELLSKGYLVRGLVTKNVTNSVSDNFENYIGDFADLQSLVTAFEGIDKVVLSFPLIFDETILLQFANNVIAAYHQSNVKQFVFNTNLPVYDKKIGFTAFDVKLAIEQLFDKEHLPYVSLRPTLYMDNLSAPFLLPVIKNNLIIPYPIPNNEKIAWLSHKDLAKYVVTALDNPKLIGKKFNIGGLQLITGDEIAKVLSKISGKEIHFLSVSPDDFEVQITPSFGNRTAKEIANIYRFTATNISHLQVKNLREEVLIDLPITLQTFEDWAKQIEWE